MRQIGIFQILLSGLCFGFLGIFGKKAFELGLTPGEFLSLRFLLAAVLLGSYLVVRKREAMRLTGKQIAACAGLGVLGYAVFSSCYFLALQGLSASLTVLLLYTYPVWVTLGAAFLFKEKLTEKHWIALPLIVIGMGALVWGEVQVSSPIALLFGVLSSIFYSFYILASSRWLKGVDPFVAAFFIMLAAGIALSSYHLQLDSFPLSREIWLVVFATALIGTLLAMSFFLSGLQKLKNSEAALLSAAEPVTGVLLASLLLGEVMRTVQWVGGAMILLGMVLVARSKDLTKA